MCIFYTKARVQCSLSGRPNSQFYLRAGGVSSTNLAKFIHVGNKN